MKSIICHSYSGTCNRIIPILSLFRISKILNRKFYVIWYSSKNNLSAINHCGLTDYPYTGKDTEFTNLFKKINGINLIDKTELKNLKKNKKMFTYISYYGNYAYYSKSKYIR